ncbi:ABC transporter substrate-binding protein [Rathayibacter tanaceti]|uniref:ABC transporter substrate-binding protein n=2 Tax=Rathayibacter tanaceti TaxID=1671680 RepID=A0A162GH75_9MICO|nr:ABC transporter substrate-binding protein [Rathayibacter tanaceti]KZX21069.1 Periplasmic binding protein [Rathayibacter tanaceti]QHC55215.1 ABC transporter substrate-binding protein [Rathayibacter tanaceti]TCO36495.1 iron complex transport system substrate-binding protein [Rathayibacter tanaceti]
MKTRRKTTTRALAALALGALLLVQTACASGADSGQADSTSTSGGFQYTDARGETVALDAVPDTIVMSEQAAAALIPYGIRPVGIWGSSTPDTSGVLKGLDLSGIETLGVSYGDVDVDKLASLEPDLVITGWYAGDYLGGLGAQDAEVSKQIEQVAPMVTVSAQKSASASLDDWRALASTLGADVDSGTIATEKTAYDEAVEQLKAALAARPGTTAYAVAPSTQFYVAIPDEFAELIDYAGWGLDVRQSSVARDATSGSFSPVSWENAGDYASDLLLYDTRSWTTPLAQVERDHPTVATLEAVGQGHVVDWTTDATFNYASYAQQIALLTTAVTALPASGT